MDQSGEWRTEYWADMKVDVPADWGYGGAPMASGGDVVSCFPEQMLEADGQRVPTNQMPGQVGYVGRPIAMTDVCVPYPDNRPDLPHVPYVWLGADVEVGTVDLGDGFVQETVEVNGSTLTVASTDAALRERILDSAGGGEMCLSEIETGGSIEHDGPLAAELEPTSMTVCAYRSDDGTDPRAPATLAYAGRVGRAATDEYFSHVAVAGPAEGPVPRGQHRRVRVGGARDDDRRRHDHGSPRGALRLPRHRPERHDAARLRDDHAHPGARPPVGGRRDLRGDLRSDGRQEGRCSTPSSARKVDAFLRNA